MRHYFKIIFFILLCNSLYNCEKPKGELHSINLYITTVTAIQCENLKTHSQLKNSYLSNEDVNNLQNVFLKLKPIEKSWRIDARYFGTFISNSKKYNFCGGVNTIEINNRKYFVNDDLRRIIINLTNN